MPPVLGNYSVALFGLVRCPQLGLYLQFCIVPLMINCLFVSVGSPTKPTVARHCKKVQYINYTIFLCVCVCVCACVCVLFHVKEKRNTWSSEGGGIESIHVATLTVLLFIQVFSISHFINHFTSMKFFKLFFFINSIRALGFGIKP